MNPHHRLPIIGLLSLGPCLTPLLAQTIPDAGALRQQLDQSRPPPPLPQSLPPPQESLTPAPKEVGVQVKVSAFEFVGNTLLDRRRLQRALDSFINRSLDYGQLQNATGIVTELYRQSGWVARAYLPEQNVSNGVVTIRIVEAVFGGMRVEGPEPSRVLLSDIAHIVDSHQKVGAILNADSIDRALLLADDLPGVAVTGSLVEGNKPGQTDLVLRFSNKPRFNGSVALDNGGSISTGSTRLSANLSLNSPLKLGDQFTANIIESEGSNYLRLGGTVPVGSDGWRVGGSASAIDYKLVLSEYSPLQAKGSSSSWGLEAAYPLVRSRQSNLYFNANADQKNYDNSALGTSTSHYAVSNVSLGLWGNRFDNFGGGGSNSGNLSWINGTVDLAGSANQPADAAGARVAGSFSKARYGFTRQQTLNSNLSLYAALSGQWADKNLDSSEKFYLGGDNGVRAYPANEAGGANGQLLNMELRWRLGNGFNLSAFHDVGHVTTNVNSQFPGAPAVNDITLLGHGLALNWQGSSGLNLKTTWAQRIGNNPNPTAAGNDQDGSKVIDRWWFAANLPL